MKLPVLSEVKHLSPSSLQEMERCNMSFYLKRMMGLAWPESTQSSAAGCGSAFDAFVKAEIAERLGLQDDPKNQLSNLLKSSVEEQNAHVIPLGQALFMEYKRTKMLDRLMDEGLCGIEMSERKVLKVGDTEIPVLGKPDAVLADGTMVDWKVQGSMSKSGASPTPGYCFGRRGFDYLGEHKRCGESLDQLKPEWALQLAIYSWLYSGVEPFRDLPVAIENVTVRGTKYTFTSIRTHITAGFQEQLWHRLNYAWGKAQSGEMTEANPSYNICYAYRSKCPVADRCEAFAAWEQNGKGDGGESTDITDKLMGR